MKKINILIFDEERGRRQYLFYKLQYMETFNPVLCGPVETSSKQLKLFNGSAKRIPHSVFPKMSVFPRDAKLTENDIVLVNATTYAYVSIANEVAEKNLLPFVFTESNRFFKKHT